MTKSERAYRQIARAAFDLRSTGHISAFQEVIKLLECFYPGDMTAMLRQEEQNAKGGAPFDTMQEGE